MKRSHAGSLHFRRRSGIANGDLAESNLRSSERNRHSVRFGLALLLVALSVGLAAALFLTIGNAHADIFLLSANASF